MKKVEANNSLSNRNLSQMRSVAELKQAQSRVRRAIKYAEEDFRDEYDAAMNMYSWKDYLALAFTVFDNVQSIGRYLGKGLYSGVAKAFRRRERRHDMVDDEC